MLSRLKPQSEPVHPEAGSLIGQQKAHMIRMNIFAYWDQPFSFPFNIKEDTLQVETCIIGKHHSENGYKYRDVIAHGKPSVSQARASHLAKQHVRDTESFWECELKDSWESVEQQS